MPLTGAERAKRFREKLKQDPEKYDAYKKKQVNRVKKCQKKIDDLNDEEKEIKRKQWRNQKAAQKKKKANKLKKDKEKTKELKVSNNLKKKLKCANNSLIKSEKREERLNLIVGRLRKRLQRTKSALEAKEREINILENKVQDIEEDREKLEKSIQETYKNDCKTQESKRLLKKIVQNYTQKSNIKYPTHKILGLKKRIQFAYKPRKVNTKVQEEIKSFYLRDDVTRCTAGKRECRTKQKKKMQIRYMVDTLYNLYQIYRKDGGRHSFSTFYRCKPFYVLSPTIGARDTCMCIKHSNIDFILRALKSSKIVLYKNIEEMVHVFSCDMKSFDCMHGKCINCKTPHIEYNKERSNEEMKWWKWVRVDHKYEKAGREITTKKTIREEQNGTVDNLVTELETALVPFKVHYFNWKEQQRQYRKCVNNLKEDEIMILCDFSENFDCKYSNEIQSMHFGASKTSITIHTGIIIFKQKCQTFATVSDSNCHEPDAIWAHLLPIIKYAKENNPINVIHFFSDGPTSQYRQKKNFYLLNLFADKLKLKFSTWSFSESGHGKSIADGVGGSVKRQLDTRVRYGTDVTNATDAYNVLNGFMKSVKCFYINEKDIESIRKLIPPNIKAVPGTMKLHQIISKQKYMINYRLLSCFCGDKRGLCNCHCPETHMLVSVGANCDDDSILMTDNIREVKTAGNHIVHENITDNMVKVDNAVMASSTQNILGDGSLHILHDNITDSAVNIDNAVMTSSTENILGDDSLLPSITAGSVDDLIIPDLWLNDINFIIDNEILLEKSHNTEQASIVAAENANIVETKKEDANPRSSSLSPRGAANEPVIDLTCTQKMVSQNAQQFPDPRKRVRMLMPGHSGPPTKKNREKISEKENKRNIKVLLPNTKRNFRCYVCHLCKSDYLCLKEMIKCMVCKNWMCLNCSGTDSFDYICPICLNDSD